MPTWDRSTRSWSRTQPSTMASHTASFDSSVQAFFQRFCRRLVGLCVILRETRSASMAVGVSATITRNVACVIARGCPSSHECRCRVAPVGLYVCAECLGILELSALEHEGQILGPCAEHTVPAWNEQLVPNAFCCAVVGESLSHRLLQAGPIPKSGRSWYLWQPEKAGFSEKSDCIALYSGCESYHDLLDTACLF